MLMADTFAIFFSILGGVLGHVALWLVCRGLFPKASKMAGESADRSIVFPLLVGIPMSVVAVVAIVIVSSILGGVGHALAVVATCLFLFYAHIGLSGLVGTVGARLGSADQPASPYAATIKGGTALAMAWVLPFLGWFGLLPLSIVIGAGATTIGIFNRLAAHERKVAPAAPPSQTLPSAASLAPVSPWR